MERGQADLTRMRLTDPCDFALSARATVGGDATVARTNTLKSAHHRSLVPCHSGS